MQFGFYPGHENGCGHPRDCPHLGGASVDHLVHIVNSSENSRLLVHRQLDAERERNSKLVADVLRLEKALKQAQLELRLERQNKFATSKKSDCDNGQSNSTAKQTGTGKRGAPVGHAGWSRKTPTQYDIRVDVPGSEKGTDQKRPDSFSYSFNSVSACASESIPPFDRHQSSLQRV